MEYILKYNENKYWNRAVTDTGKEEVSKTINFINQNIEYFNYSDFNRKYDNSRNNILNIPYPQLIQGIISRIKIFEKPNLSYTELSILYAIYDYILESIEKYGEIEDYFLEWADDKKWGIEKSGLGTFKFIIDSNFTNISDFFIDLDKISKRHNLKLDMLNIDKTTGNFLMIYISAKKS